jgi:hypothetical protein
MTRKCGDCQLCCRLVPVVELGKPAGLACKYQRHGKGCTIYAQRPPSCRLWSCRWLVEDDTADQHRPDRARYVIDIMPDFVELKNNETSEASIVQVVQVWADDKFRDPSHDPALRRYMERRAAENIGTIVRWNATRDSMVIFPPAMSSDGEWHEITDGKLIYASPAQRIKALGEASTAKVNL